MVPAAADDPGQPGGTPRLVAERRVGEITVKRFETEAGERIERFEGNGETLEVGTRPTGPVTYFAYTGDPPRRSMLADVKLAVSPTGNRGEPTAAQVEEAERLLRSSGIAAVGRLFVPKEAAAADKSGYAAIARAWARLNPDKPPMQRGVTRFHWNDIKDRMVEEDG